MSKVKFSVVIPAYNSEKYIESSVGSVLSQTYGNFEVLIVDDGSTDGTGEICDGFVDERVRVIHIPNSGAFTARRTGIEAATGDYVTFLDSDDWYDPDYLECAAAEIEKENPDMIIYSFRIVDGEIIEERPVVTERTAVSRTEEKNRLMKRFLTESTLNSLALKVIKRPITGLPPVSAQESFENFSNGEDFVESVLPMIKAEKIILTGECHYNYRKVTDSVTKRKQADRYKNVMWMKEYRLKLLDTLGYNDRETSEKLANLSMTETMRCVKEIAGTNLTYREKKLLYNDISNNSFYNNFIREKMELKRLGKQCLGAYILFRCKLYRIIILLVK